MTNNATVTNDPKAGIVTEGGKVSFDMTPELEEEVRLIREKHLKKSESLIGILHTAICILIGFCVVFLIWGVK